MRYLSVALGVAVMASAVSAASAAEIAGEYLESRSCDVYTGPCFANGEMNLAGKDAIMAWKVDEGRFNDVSLDGLGVALVLRAENTLGYDGVFEMDAGEIKSLVLVDENATDEQRDALVAFVKDSAEEFTQNVIGVQQVPLVLENDHLEGRGIFKAGEVAQIETRALKQGDCVCSNEVVYYQPLGDVENFSPAYSETLSFQGDGLNRKWEMHGLRSSFLATFRR